MHFFLFLHWSFGLFFFIACRNLWVMFLTVFALLLPQCKFIYFPILSIMLLPVENFKSRRFYWTFIFSVAVSSVLLGWGWNKLATDMTVLLNFDGRTTQEKIRFILTQPWQFLPELWQTISRTWKITLANSVQKLGTYDIPEYACFYVIYYLVLLSCFFCNREKSLAVRWSFFSLS